MEASTDGILEETVFGAGNDIDDTTLENERCGICTDVIIDRGVLDCCDHWFCFACIDNWATITNLCPFCKNEFQLITCIPVYDTIGSIKVEEDSLSRDDDWCIQGNNNTLSFPSYYIDEDAVICLDGDDCKIRGGLATTEEDITLDTSIACDSCDLWYHAFCVGFDPEITSQNSWLCPRCKIDEVPHKSQGAVVQRPSEQLDHENSNIECSTEAGFSGKLLVSVADAGETALVVSMVEGKQWTESTDNIRIDILNVSKDKKPGAAFNFNAGTSEFKMQLNGSAGSFVYDKEKTAKAHAVESQENSEPSLNVSPQKSIIKPVIDEDEASLALSLSQDASFLLPNCSLGHSHLKTCDVQNASCSDEHNISTPLLINTFDTMDESESGSFTDLHLGLCGASFSVDKMAGDCTEDQMAGDVHQQNLLVESSSADAMVSVEEMTIGANDIMAGVAHQESLDVGVVKRKYTEISRDSDHGDNNIEDKGRDAEDKVSTKKLRSDAKSRMTPLKSQVNTLDSNGSQGISVVPEQSKDKLKQIPEKKANASDIMRIVRSTERRSSKAPAHRSTAEKSIKGDDVGGLRVKKIMRRVANDKSSTLLEELRKEIREAIGDKTAKDGENNGIFDAQLLTAFRAAIARPENESMKKINPSFVRGKKRILQKGKIRENLTKKLYGTTNGRRRRAWDRDWEIEFWKHRCMKTQPQKVDTLMSVLALLKRNSDIPFMESSEKERAHEGVATNSILSRVYLADTSVFPRKDDVKPLSVLKHEKNEEHSSSNVSEKGNKSVQETPMVGASTIVSKTSLQGRVASSGNTGKRGNCPSFKEEATNRKEPTDGSNQGLNFSSVSNGSKGTAQSKEQLSKSDDKKIDKRKWALEVLARKTASTSKDATKRSQEDEAFKGNYPLLAELPTDMRPVLAPSRHSKIPKSVRQAQLYRLTEHYLRKTNLLVMHRTADTELAVADAVNVEKNICDKSNSKLVYTNLCAQVVSQISGSLKPTTAQTTAAEGLENLEHAVENASPNHAPETCDDVKEALRKAGLLSDSPPNSPHRSTNKQNDEDSLSPNVMDEDPVNVFDIDSHLELDIYGDFEYSMEDDDYGGPSSVATTSRVSKLQLEDGESKMQVVLSTINIEKSCNALGSIGDTTKPLNSGVGLEDNDHEKPNFVGAQMESPMLKCETDGCKDKSALEVPTATSCLSLEPLQSEKDEELSLEECEELYGPDKEPLVNKIYDQPSREPSKCMENEATAENAAVVGNENSMSNKATAVSKFETEKCAENNFVEGCFPVENDSSGGENSPKRCLLSGIVPKKVEKSETHQQSDTCRSIARKVEAYIKEHIRPLCKSGVITTEQYRWAVGKTTDKVMRYHSKDKNANFLIKEGAKVKKLAEQYVEAAKQKT